MLKYKDQGTVAITHSLHNYFSSLQSKLTPQVGSSTKFTFESARSKKLCDINSECVIVQVIQPLHACARSRTMTSLMVGSFGMKIT